MIRKLTYIISDQTNPYRNLAFEEYLLNRVEPGECILYLWQNRHTVVIGKNQNAWKECNIDLLKQDGAFLARRLSGGGAVYHDLGNLNFTFLAQQQDYNVEKQLQVILRAVQLLGLKAEKTGRNDITIDGRKFSGNAFYETGGRCYHHGTLMVQVNVQNLSRYLNVSEDKLRSKGVESVKSRVTNLKEHSESVDVESLKEKLIEAFGEVYGLMPQSFPAERLNEGEILALEKRFASWDWILGRKIAFDFEASKRFAWGDLTLQLSVNGGYIRDAAAYSDALDQDIIAKIPDALMDIMFDKLSVCEALSRMEKQTAQEHKRAMLEEINRFLSEQNF